MLTGGLIGAVFSASAFVTLAQERQAAATWGSRIFLSAAPLETEESQ
jgi:hypothetical protein